MRIYALTPTGYDRAKSFYGKANIIEENGEVILQSYDTFVCMINKRGAFVRLWGGYSATTMRHINVVFTFSQEIVDAVVCPKCYGKEDAE